MIFLQEVIPQENTVELDQKEVSQDFNDELDELFEAEDGEKTKKPAKKSFFKFLDVEDSPQNSKFSDAAVFDRVRKSNVDLAMFWDVVMDKAKELQGQNNN